MKLLFLRNGQDVQCPFSYSLSDLERYLTLLKNKEAHEEQG